MKTIIIGAGAAGCFAAINLKRMAPEADVTVVESGRKALAKVAVTGGGRCNLTNSFAGIKSLATAYPRGERLMKRLLNEFDHNDTCRWFEKEGVRLVTQDDECVFPASQDAMEIVGTLTRLMGRLGVKLKTNHRVEHIYKVENGNGGFGIAFTDSALPPLQADMVIVTTGGCPRLSGPGFPGNLGVDMAEPVPSLFSICLPDNPITALTGTVVADVTATLTGTKTQAYGPLLITHWGMSGPAILKLSAYAARTLHDNGYKARISINWMGTASEQETMETLMEMAIRNPGKQLQSVYPTRLNSRLWTHLIEKSGLKPTARWGEMARKSYNKMVNTLVNDQYYANGKCRFKEEFVTCGGVVLSNISAKTLECKHLPGLYFAGEVLDVDAITGGFNLQAAWTMGYVAAKSAAQKQ